MAKAGMTQLERIVPISIAVGLCIFLFMCIVWTTGSSRRSDIRAVKIQKPVEEGEYTIPKLVWSYWDSDAPPEIVQSLLENTKRKMKGWECIHLTESKVGQYIQKDSFPDGYTDLSKEAKSDWIRLYLLKSYGGLWMDCGILINHAGAINAMWHKSREQKSEMTGFYLADKTLNGDTRSYIENWFLMAPKDSLVISEWLEEFERAIALGFEEYNDQLTKRGIRYPNIYGKHHNDTYLTQHATLQYTLQNRLEYTPTILLESAGESMFKVQKMCNWEPQCLIEKLMKDPSIKEIPYIKLTGADRKYVGTLKGYFGAAAD